MRNRAVVCLATLLRLAGIPAIAAGILLTGGCGGGTTGTGGTGGGSVIEGRLLDVEGVPVPEALLTVIETGDSSLTDQAGSFSIETEIPAPSVTLLVESGTTKAETVVDELPKGEQAVDLDLELNPAQKTVKVKSKRVRPRPTRTPSIPTPTPVPSIEPTAPPADTAPPLPEAPTETPTPDPTHTAAPTVGTETPTPTPTAVSTAGPQLPLKTKITGVIHTVDPAILIGAEVNIPGRARKAVEADGTFKFYVAPSRLNGILAFHSGGKTDRIFIAGVSERAAEVNLNLDLKVRLNGGLKLSLISVEIIERSSGETSPATEEGERQTAAGQG